MKSRNSHCRVWVGLVLSALLMVVSPSLATAFEDRTASIIAGFGERGVRLVGQIEAGGILFKLHISASAQKLVDTKTFDKPDPEFNQEAYHQFLLKQFYESGTYLTQLLRVSFLNEVILVIDDMGEDRKNTISYATVNSRVITMDLRRWHKIGLGYGFYLGDISSAHELTHVFNYFLDSEETKYHRELVAPFVEALNVQRKTGMENFLANYLKRVAGDLASPELVLQKEFKGSTPLRHLVHWLLKSVSDGTYVVQGEKVRALEKLAMAYVQHPAHGDEGFDESAKAVGITLLDGTVLTLDRVRNDLYRALTEKPAAFVK